jgi:hypothetical protein
MHLAGGLHVGSSGTGMLGLSEITRLTFWAQSAAEGELPDQVVLALCVLVDQQGGKIPVWVVWYAVVGDDLHKLGPGVFCSQLLDALPHLSTVRDPALFFCTKLACWTWLEPIHCQIILHSTGYEGEESRAIRRVNSSLLVFVEVYDGPHVLAPLRDLSHKLLPHNADHSTVPTICSILSQLPQSLLSAYRSLTL